MVKKLQIKMKKKSNELIFKEIFSIFANIDFYNESKESNDNRRWISRGIASMLYAAQRL
jgi:hypothetical protein